MEYRDAATPRWTAGRHGTLLTNGGGAPEKGGGDDLVRLLLDSTAEGIYGIDLDGNFTFCNAAGLAMLRYASAAEILGRNAHSLIRHTRPDGEPYRTDESGVFRAIQENRGSHSEIEIFWRADGTSFSAESWSHPMRKDGVPIGAVVTFLDITERLAGEAALRESEARQHAVFDTALDGLILMDHEGHVAEFNPAAERIFQYSRDEVLGKLMADLIIPPSLRESHRKGLARFNATGDAVILGRRIEVPAMRRDGSEFPAELSITRINREGPAVFAGEIRDLTEQKRVQLEMRRSEERFRKLFDSNTIGIVIADLNGNTLEANDAYLGMLGRSREELLSGEIRWKELTPPEYSGRDQAAVEELRRTGVSAPWEKELFRKDGTRVPVLIGLAMLEAEEASCIAYIVDLTARRRLEEQFRQAQKMEVVGQLAGGIAHDFNNLLTVILGYSDLLAGKFEPGSMEADELAEIRTAGQRAASLTRQLLAFSRQQIVERKALDVNVLVVETEKMLRRLLGMDIELVTVLDPSVGRVLADAGQIEQLILNLSLNARDAMPRGGRLTIETASVELDETYARLHGTVEPGSYVMITISDTGVGMNSNTLAHMFEPFFTTKERGKGTGLGLATVYGIVQESGGHVWVYSEVGQGTTFKIHLPLLREAAERESGPEEEPASLSGTETILLVDDEESVRSLSRSILVSHGYSVLEAANGREALDVAARDPQTIHLLLTDLVMPEMGGSELASRLVVLRPGMRVLYMSGYTDDAVVRQGLVETGRLFLQKPFNATALALKVREALGG